MLGYYSLRTQCVSVYKKKENLAAFFFQRAARRIAISKVLISNFRTDTRAQHNIYKIVIKTGGVNQEITKPPNPKLEDASMEEETTTKSMQSRQWKFGCQ